MQGEYHTPAEPCQQAQEGVRAGVISSTLQTCKLRLRKGRGSPEVPQWTFSACHRPALTECLLCPWFSISLTLWDAPMKIKATYLVLLSRRQPSLRTETGHPLSLQTAGRTGQRFTPNVEGSLALCIKRSTIKSDSPGSWHHSLT